jgi:hypothetical protein
VSSLNGSGFGDFFNAIEVAKNEYFTVTLPDLNRNFQRNSETIIKKSIEELKKFKKDCPLKEEGVKD